MSAAPWPTALEPSSRTSPLFMKALISVRLASRPPPYELVRHSVLARAPEAPLGQRLALPAAAAGIALAIRPMSARPMANAPLATRRELRNCRAHKQSLCVALRHGIPGAGAGDQGERGDGARCEQRRDARVRSDDALGADPEHHRRAVRAHDLDAVPDSDAGEVGEDGIAGPPVHVAVDERVAGLAWGRAELIPGHVVEIARGVQVSLAVEPAGFDLRVQADAWNHKPDRRQVGRPRRCRLELITTIAGRRSRHRSALRLHRRRCDYQHGLISKRRKHQAEAENQNAPRHAGGILDGRTRLRALYGVAPLTVVRTGRR